MAEILKLGGSDRSAAKLTGLQIQTNDRDQRLPGTQTIARPLPVDGQYWPCTAVSDFFLFYVHKYIFLNYNASPIFLTF